MSPHSSQAFGERHAKPRETQRCTERCQTARRAVQHQFQTEAGGTTRGSKLHKPHHPCKSLADCNIDAPAEFRRVAEARIEILEAS